MCWKKDLNDQFAIIVKQNNLDEILKKTFLKAIKYFESENQKHSVISMNALLKREVNGVNVFEVILYTSQEMQNYEMIFSRHNLYIKRTA